jgi:hypothetical protein
MREEGRFRVYESLEWRFVPIHFASLRKDRVIPLNQIEDDKSLSAMIWPPDRLQEIIETNDDAAGTCDRLSRPRCDTKHSLSRALTFNSVQRPMHDRSSSILLRF